ncbi:MAG: thiamine pyrophosphate-dependent enzyme, partial [Myxococcota bacterium]
VCDLLASTDRGVLVAGPAPPAQRQARDAVFDLARRTGWPLCAEATSQLRLARATGVPRFDAFDWVWRSEKGRAPLRPEAVIQLGGAPTSAGYERLIAEAAIRRVVVAPYGWPDPASTAEALACADAGPMASAVLESMGPDAARGEGAWARRLARLDGAVWGAVDKVAGASEGALDEAGVAGEVARACDGRAALMVGNSLPVRHLDAWVRGGAADVEVVSQRGASGIDGLVSGAAGYAAASRKPTVLLVGDVSFLHDLGGLAVARRVDVSLVLVVINNGGGRIFEQLPLGDREDLAAHLGHFTTPHAASLRHAAGTFGHAYARPEDRAALREAIGSALGRGGTTLVEAVVRPHGAAEQRRRVHTEVERVLGEHGEQP